MIERLKKSFVRITMVSAALVLVVLVGIINLLNYMEYADNFGQNVSYLENYDYDGSGNGDLDTDGEVLSPGQQRDVTTHNASVQTFLFNSVIVTVAGLIVLYLVVRLTARRVIRPILESYEKQQSFITNAGHELKTPLAVIASSAEVIEMEQGESRWTRAIRSQVGRLSTLTQELIDLARMDESGSELELAEMDISAVVEKAIEPFAALAEQRGLRFKTAIQPGVRTRADRNALEKLCGILADNAVLYTSEGGEIRFSLTVNGGFVLLREENEADGLVPGKQERLFDRFYRGDTSRGGDNPGYGLGLPLARSLAEAMGGRLTAESPDGKKLVVLFQLMQKN